MSAPYDEAYDEAYDEGGEPRPQYAEVLAALDDPASLAAEVKQRLRAREIQERRHHARKIAHLIQ